MRPFIIALDINNRHERKALLAQFKEQQLYVKVGMELFYKEGKEVITELKDAGHQIFLDLKLHDIPTTVKRSMRVLAELNVDMINVHAAGGKKMIASAREGLEQGTKSGTNRPLLLAVTQLTSTDQQMMENELLISKRLPEVVSSYAQHAKDGGADGVVCSAHEVPLVHASCGKSFYIVCPGIRRKEDAVNDQKRIVTPAEAKQLGSWGIVVGRSITSSTNPYEVYKEMKGEWDGNDECTNR